MASGSLGGVSVSILARNSRGVGSNPAPGTILPSLLTSYDTGATYM